jgi:hypothetical protein
VKTVEKTESWKVLKSRVSRKIKLLYPSMPDKALELTVNHSTQPNTCRVFSTNDKGDRPRVTVEKIRKAVRAHIRHKLTDYDKLCVFNHPFKAKKMVKAEVNLIENKWRQLTQ